MSEVISNVFRTFKRRLIVDDMQKEYEHRVFQNVFSGYIKYFIGVMIVKYIFQYHWGWSYEESLDFIGTYFGVLFYVMLIPIIIYFFCVLYFGHLEGRYSVDKFSEKIFTAKYLKRVKRWYYIDDFWCLVSWSELFAFLPTPAVLAAFATGGCVAFLTLFFGYYYPQKMENFSYIGYSLLFSAFILLILNIFLRMTWLSNIVSIISMIASMIIMLFIITDVKDDYQEIKKQWPGRTDEEYERVLEAYSYFNSAEINYHIRNIIYELARIFSGQGPSDD